MKEPTKINFEEDRMESVSQIDAGKSLSDKVIELRTMEDEIQNAENSLSKLKEKAKVLSQVEIPSIPQESQQEAFKWLREHDLGDIIKNDITVTFGRGEDNKAMQYANLAKGQGFEPIQKIGVHPQTLKAVVRERLESGRDMPTGLFKTFAGNQTKITRR